MSIDYFAGSKKAHAKSVAEFMASSSSASPFGQADQRQLDLIDQMGVNSRQRINDQYGAAGGTIQALISNRGFGSSNMATAGLLGNEARKSQAGLDLEDMLLQKKLGVYQDANSQALQRYGISSQQRSGSVSSGIQSSGPLNQNYYAGLQDQLLQQNKFNQYNSQSGAGIIAKPYMNVA